MSQYNNSGIMANIPPVVKNLLLLNIIMFFISWVAQDFLQVDLDKLLGLYHFGSVYFRPFQYVTYLFMHGSLMHLLSNMFALYMFGRILEMVWGGKKFLFYYLSTGIGAAIIQTLVTHWQITGIKEAALAFSNTPSPDALLKFVTHNFPEYARQININLIDAWSIAPDNLEYKAQALQVVTDLIQLKINVPTIGASGAIFGILLAFGMLFPNIELMLLFPPIPIKAKYFVMGYGFIELFTGVANFSGDNIAHFAHLGGMIFGFILIKLWQKNKQKSYPF